MSNTLAEKKKSTEIDSRFEYSTLKKCLNCGSENIEVKKNVTLFDQFDEKDVKIKVLKECKNCDCVHYELNGVFTFIYDAIEVNRIENIGGWLDQNKIV
jgi:NAD-dependent SIR2 family protein deacetylase